MADNSEVTQASSPSNEQSSSTNHTPPATAHSAHHHGHEATFVRPSDLLRPRTTSRPNGPPKPDRPIDRDQRAGLKAIRDFLRIRNCYDVLPLSFRLIELDVGLTVKESLNIMVQCGIVSAPLWDSSTSTYAGLLTVNDYLNVVRYYNLHADKLKDVDRLLLSDLKDVEKVLDVKPPETVSAPPEAILYDALRKQLLSRARRIPLVSYDSDTGRTMVTSVITQYRILKFIAMNVKETDMLRKPLAMIKLGTYGNIVRCTMDTTVLDVIDEMVMKNISSVPVVTTEGVLLNVFEAVDVIEILKTGDYANLTWTVGKTLSARSPNHTGIYCCSLDDGLDTIFETIKRSRVHRLMVVDDNNYLKGVLSLSDILHYLLVEGQEETNQN
ncbi:AMP-activated serine/threonine-protein kinase regulatory subunit [Exophiala dermatitidis]|uniref:5'-AMP-activated protein kinase, regulatory gamma subunit n=2 Tax=Exophiala dermatitidis TaxID=5970 RepID=H6BN04_EXODN|nr:5'-AMP-activated protein kinase, regulatory gamma subunit [Exophiala dermatitidis NIH/UT8656]KAJ4512074.1 AMP-activated serine/threonine-protein kinase regulatory subunit [Exophiala dermatitidis]EHY53127.1 5'-AMP-activated protein kinase, regulatory gamma subunit [Exophiala dermatitidis NIH/UT8656]KAJ4514959.1 AMP-activated serine/threonine-protein kinase regulatory subunit [Exophiala dermatitidis]KAJ4517450.1 AMP-activated serine/threonine-protein kinase regulatory subunit [Exophiala dermat